MCTITSLPAVVVRFTLNYLHPLDLGKLLFCSKPWKELIVDQAHRWGTVGKLGKRPRNSTLFRRYVRLATDNRLCYHCYERKNGRSKYRATCDRCTTENVLSHVHRRAWVKIERLFARVQHETTFLGHLARTKRNPRQTRHIGRRPRQPYGGVHRMQSFGDYVAQIGRKVLKEQLILLTAQEYRSLPPGNLQHLFTDPTFCIHSTWRFSVTRKLVNRYYRSWDIFSPTLPNFTHDLYPTVKRLIPVQHHHRLLKILLQAHVERLRTRRNSDVAHCRRIERQLLLQRLDNLKEPDYRLEFPYKSLGVNLTPMIERIVHYTTSLVGPNVLLLEYPYYREVVRNNLLYSIFRIVDRPPVSLIRQTWP